MYSSPLGVRINNANLNPLPLGREGGERTSRVRGSFVCHAIYASLISDDNSNPVRKNHGRKTPDRTRM